MTTLATTPARRLATVRRLPVPDHRPPPEGPEPSHPRSGARPAAQSALMQGTLALAFVLPSGLPASPAPPAGLHLVPAAHDPAADVDFGPVPTPSALLPDPRPWAARLTQALAEVLTGDRPLVQLVRWTTADVYEQLQQRLTAAGPRRSPAAARPRLSSVRVDQPADGVAEIAAVVHGGTRATAMALRLEGLDGRWQCSALEFA